MSALRRERLNRGLEISELAKSSGISDDQIRNIENGSATNPRASTLFKLADALSQAGELVLPSDIDPMAAQRDQETAA